MCDCVSVLFSECRLYVVGRAARVCVCVCLRDVCVCEREREMRLMRHPEESEERARARDRAGVPSVCCVSCARTRVISDQT